MSLINILQPNQYNIFAGSFNSSNPINITTNGYVIRHWTAQTVGATPVICFSYAASNNKAYSVETMCQGLSTVNDISSLKRGGSFSFFGGVLSYRGFFYDQWYSSPGLPTTALNYSVTGSNINVYLVGVAGKTVNWSGVTYIYF